MSAEELNVKNALRRFLWLAVCCNDHNFSPNEVIHKCRDLCTDLGISNINEANSLLERTKITVVDAKELPGHSREPPGPPSPPAGFSRRWGDDTEQPKPSNVRNRPIEYDSS